MSRFFHRFLISLLLISPCALSASRPIHAEALPIPGELRSSGNTWKIFFEGGWVLNGPLTGPWLLQGNDGKTVAQLDLRTVREKKVGAEALGIEVEEADLGSHGSSKSYLKGKKVPKGRALNPEALSASPENATPTQENTQQVQGIPITFTQYPNQSYRIKFAWGKTTEEAFFDGRNTLIQVVQTRQEGPWTITLEQWADGSFKRRYQNSNATLQHTYDSIDESYRVSLINPQGEILNEVYCQETCSQE